MAHKLEIEIQGQAKHNNDTIKIFRVFEPITVIQLADVAYLFGGEMETQMGVVGHCHPGDLLETLFLEQFTFILFAIGVPGLLVAPLLGLFAGGKDGDHLFVQQTEP